MDPAGGCDPFELAQSWLDAAEPGELNDPNAMALATVDSDGLPNVRMVLLKEIEGAAPGGRGAFVFYTNFESAKGRELAANPKAAIVLHWKSLRRQLRARGAVERAPDEQADAYFRSRSYKSRIGAWASAQSRPLTSRTALIAEAGLAAARYPLDPPRPPHWGGFRIIPEQIEFWSDGAHRLHDRFLWRWTGENWDVTRLNP
ncbi:MAG: pyridoxamine 5'-phosphate oxidase [Neomegalonema sp.]|nr:pyridoxamine 5'-phosphate oxidase [Neomegalonema sp.]